MMQDGGNSLGALDELFSSKGYLYFHDAIYPPERRQIEVDFLVGALALTKSMRLLDAGCGHGRHSNRLSAHVAEILALDRNGEFLEVAKREADENGIRNIKYEQADIREIDFPSAFDRVVLANTIFGIFSDAENALLLRRLGSSLRPDGLLFFDVVNRDVILCGLQHHAITECSGDYLLDRLSFDPETGRMSNGRVYIRSGVATEAPFSLRVYNRSEISALLTQAGLKLVSAYDGWTGKPFNAQSKKILIVASHHIPADP